MPDLSVTRDTLLRHIGRELGWGRNPSDWSDAKHSDAEDIIAKALRQFYAPPLLMGETAPHRWSFLRPTHHMTTVPNVGDYDLPADFGGMDSDLYYADEDVGVASIQKTSDTRIYSMREGGHPTTGYPRYYALAPLPANGDEPQVWSLLFEPIPDSAIELKFIYRSNPYQLTASKPYPLGGMTAADALLTSAIAAAHAFINDDPAGVYYAAYLERLRAAVVQDRQENVARNLGYNGDPGRRERLFDRAVYASYNGTIYDGS